MQAETRHQVGSDPPLSPNAPGGVSPPSDLRILAPSIPDHEPLRCIGRGSYGEVWLARNVVGSFRAVKIVYRNTFVNDRPYEREYAGIQKFEPVSRSHDGFVDILQIGRNDEAGYFYYVMELADPVPGSEFRVSHSTNVAQPETRNPELETYVPHTLRSEIARSTRLSFDDCVALGLSLTRALAYLHAHGLVHRDIKPSNIIFVSGVPKLADIGLVTDAGEARSYVGTEGFIPPEGPGTPTADLFGLGKVLYEASTGKDRQDFPEPLTNLGDQHDKDRLLELNAILHRACHSDLRARYRSAAEMVGELELLQRGESVKRRRTRERRSAVASRTAVVVAVIGLVVAAGLRLSQRLTWRPSASGHHQPNSNPLARDFYEKGLMVGRPITKSQFTYSVEQLNRAIELDPNFPEAYVALADAYRQISEWHLPPKQAMAEAKKNIQRALALDDSCPAALLNSGWIYMHYEWNWEAAGQMFLRAMATAPTNGMVHCDYAWYLRLRGRLDEAGLAQRKAQRLAPSNFVVTVATAWQLCLERRFDELEQTCAELKRAYPSHVTLQYWLARMYERQGRYAQADVELSAHRAVDDGPDLMGMHGHLCALRGKREQALALLAELQALKRIRYVSPFFPALIYAGLGDKEKAIAHLEQAVEDRSSNLTDLKMDPRWDSFRADGRFLAILKQIGLEE